MKITVAHEGFEVRIKDGDLKDDQGRDAAELIDWRHHIIWLSGRMPVQRRLHSLFHGVRHAWQMTVGMPADSESDADQSASYAISTWQQLERMGGEAALARLQPDGTIEKSIDIDAPASRWEPRCPDCNGYLELPIRNGAPKFDERLGRLVVRRCGDCEHCGHSIVWSESCTSRGTLTGHPVSPPVKVAARAAQVV